MSTLKVDNIRHNSATSDAITMASDGTCTAKLTSIGGGGLSHRNKALNGEMKISQRGTTFSPTTSSTYLLDGWRTDHGSSGNLDTTITQSTDTPSGFSKSLKITPDSTLTPSGSQNGLITQYIEGQDLQDLGFGTSDAKPITVSWYAKTSATGAGNYTVKVEYYDGSTYYAVNKLFAFTTTWTRYTYTIPATGTATTNGIRDTNNWGLKVEYHLFSGPDDVHSQFTQWATNAVPTFKVISGQKNFMDNTSNELYLTGFQIEVGDTMTEYEHIRTSEELARCQRYCVVYGGSGARHLGTAHAYNSTNLNLSLHVPVPMRVGPTPSTVLASGNWLQAYMGATGVQSNASINVSDVDTNHSSMRAYLQNAHSGRTEGQALWVHTLPNAKLILSAEI